MDIASFRRTQAELARLESELTHALRHIATICDAQDAGEDVRPHIHQASAYLLATGTRRPR